MRVIHAANTHRLQVYEWQQTQSLGKKKKKTLHTLEIIHAGYTTKPAYNVQTHPKRQDLVSYFFSFLLYLSTNRNIRTRLHVAYTNWRESQSQEQKSRHGYPGM